MAVELRDLVVCSLERWDEIWRRNQFFVDILLRRNPGLRVLFVEPAADVLFDLTQRRRPSVPRFRPITADRRLTALSPIKVLPRRLGPATDALLRLQVRVAARWMGLAQPVLWINDVTYATLIEQTGWPSVYDITDDWLLAPFPSRELRRLRRLDEIALRRADEVVVCSTALEKSRGAARAVSVVQNGVDVQHFRRPRPRPPDLPPAPTAVYVGSLHDARLDVELVARLAAELPEVNVVLVGPDSLSAEHRHLLVSCLNVRLLGERPYEDVPAYFQHADVVIVPHRVTPFTESLDPIKAYECLVIGTPTVATPVAGFREHAPDLLIASGERFADRVREAMSAPRRGNGGVKDASWDERARAFENVLRRAQQNATAKPSCDDLR